MLSRQCRLKKFFLTIFGSLNSSSIRRGVYAYVHLIAKMLSYKNEKKQNRINWTNILKASYIAIEQIFVAEILYFYFILLRRQPRLNRLTSLFLVTILQAMTTKLIKSILPLNRYLLLKFQTLQSIYVTRDRVILKFEARVQIYMAVLNIGCKIQNFAGNVVSFSKINSCEISF